MTDLYKLAQKFVCLCECDKKKLGGGKGSRKKKVPTTINRSERFAVARNNKRTDGLKLWQTECGDEFIVYFASSLQKICRFPCLCFNKSSAFRRAKRTIAWSKLKNQGKSHKARKPNTQQKIYATSISIRIDTSKCLTLVW